MSKDSSNQQLVHSASWSISMEIVAKVSRIATIVVLASKLPIVAYGIAMLALVCHELFAQTLRAGVGTHLIQCKASELSKIASNGLTYQLILSGVVASIQWFSAPLIASYYGIESLQALLQWLAFSYLLFPLVSIQVFLLQRNNQMKHFSIINAICITAENISIALLALVGHGIMSVVYGKLIFSVLWFLLFISSKQPFYGFAFDKKVIRQLFEISKLLLVTEWVKTARQQIDVIIAAKYLVPELFGLYTFAKNAGVGVSQSINTAYITALYPHLCQLNNQRTRINLKRVYSYAALISLVFLLQALLVPIYIPLLFPEQWQNMHGNISILCLSAIPWILVETHYSIYRSYGNYRYETTLRSLMLIASATFLLLFGNDQPERFAVLVLMINTLMLVYVITTNLCQHKSISESLGVVKK